MLSKIFRRNRAATEGRSSGALLDGAYRRHRPQDVEYFTRLARDAFPKFAGRIQCFGADWLGNQFATDASRIVGGHAQILLLEPGTGEALEIPSGIEDFHTRELVIHADAAVAYSFYRKWLTAGGQKPSYDQCVGYKKPLYLGGEDEVTNLAISDFDVYWTISAQLLAKVRGLPPGTSIRDVSIRD